MSRSSKMSVFDAIARVGRPQTSVRSRAAIQSTPLPKSPGGTEWQRSDAKEPHRDGATFPMGIRQTKVAPLAGLETMTDRPATASRIPP